MVADSEEHASFNWIERVFRGAKRNLLCRGDLPVACLDISDK